MVRGGDIRQFKLNSREFDIAADSAVNIMAAGYNNENTPTGNGNIATVQKRKLGGFTDLVLSIKDSKQDLEFLQGIWNAGAGVPVSITKATGATYSGTLSGEGEVVEDTSAGTITISMLGTKFEQI